jgi:hypothetical protein
MMYRIRIIFGLLLMIAAAAAPAAADSWIKVSDIPDPFSEHIIQGKAITEIRIEGNEDTQETIILRAMTSKVGAVYTDKSARADRRWLFQLGVFTSIFFYTIPDGDGVILVVKVTRTSRRPPSKSRKRTASKSVCRFRHRTCSVAPPACPRGPGSGAPPISASGTRIR